MAKREDALAAVRRVLANCSGDDPDLDAWLERTVKARRLPAPDEIDHWFARAVGFHAGVCLGSGPRDRRAHRANARVGAVMLIEALAAKKRGTELDGLVDLVDVSLDAAGKAPDLQHCKNGGGR